MLCLFLLLLVSVVRPQCGEYEALCPDGSCIQTKHLPDGGGFNDTKAKLELDTAISDCETTISPSCNCTLPELRIWLAEQLFPPLNDTARRGMPGQGCPCDNATKLDKILSRVEPDLSPICPCLTNSLPEFTGVKNFMKQQLMENCGCANMTEGDGDPPQCPCPTGEFWCRFTKSCIISGNPCDDSLVNEGDVFCYHNEFQCWIDDFTDLENGGYHMCVQSEQECMCYRMGMWEICVVDGNVFCANDVSECSTRNFNTECTGGDVLCDDGSCQPDWNHCQCSYEGKKWCEMLWQCIPHHEPCSNVCPAATPHWCDAWGFCCFHEDCRCKNELNNGEAIYCYETMRCEYHPDDCKVKFDFCGSIGQVQCANQSLSAMGEKKMRISESKIRNDPTFMQFESSYTATNTFCGGPMIDLLVKTVVVMEFDHCFCETNANFNGFVNELKNGMVVNGANCSDECAKTEMNTSGVNSGIFTEFGLYGQQFQDACDCGDMAGGMTKDEMNMGGDKPAVICGPSEYDCDRCTTKGKVPCMDGTCALTLDNCFKVDVGCTNFGMIECPTGSMQVCADDIGSCNGILDCWSLGWVDCGKGDCYPTFNECPVDMCGSMGMMMCPGSDPMFPECVMDTRQCNQSCNDRASKHMCMDGTCVQYREECWMGTCMENHTRCPDLECVHKDSRCCSNEEFRCFLNQKCIPHHEGWRCSAEADACGMNKFPCTDGSGRCVSEPHECMLPKCDSNSIRCNDGSCRLTNDTVENGCRCGGVDGEIYCPNKDDCFAFETFEMCKDCPQGFQRCRARNGTKKRMCVQDIDDCADTTQCGPGEGLCTDPKRCVRDYFACDMFACPFVCPGTDKCVINIEDCCDVGTGYCYNGANAGTCVNFDTFWDDCPDESYVDCDWNAGEWMCHDGNCVMNHSQCGCPNDMFECMDGDCVYDETACMADKGDYMCHGMVLCPDGTCQPSKDFCAQLFECPYMFMRCPNGVDCIPFDDDVSMCPQTVECPAHSPVFCKANKACEIDISFCPKAIMCPTGEIVCWDQSCAVNAKACPIASTCASNEVRCPMGGECRPSLEHCPKGFVCGPNEKLCPGNICMYNMDECPTMDVCDGYLCPGSQMCVAEKGHCPSMKMCPPGMLQCASGVCVYMIEECEMSVCPPGMVECPGHPGMCVYDMAMECPTMKVCPSYKSFLCWNDACREGPDDCDDYSYCEESSKMCPDGACVPFFNECPKKMTCPPEFPVLCDNMDCVSDKMYCQDFDCTEIFCDGMCVTDHAFCPSSMYCEGVMCWDGSCMEDVSYCPPKQEYFCPDPSLMFMCGDGNCYASGMDCPAPMNCPPERPIFCPEGKCVKREKDCSDNFIFECPPGEYLCNDRITCSYNGTCPSIVVCTADMPFKCMDGTCRKGQHACPDVNECDWMYEKRCWDGSCAPFDPQNPEIDHCPPSIQCPPETPVLCPNYACAQSSSNCTDEFKCPPGSMMCRNGMCVPDQAACDIAMPDVCPPDHLGRHMFMCGDGRCVKDETYCWDDVTGCPPGQVKCWQEDGSCQVSCDGITVKDCPGGKTKCIDGTCRSNCSDVLQNGCTESQSKFCFSVQKCVADTETCPTNAFCPDGLKRCDGGMCLDMNDICQPPPEEMKKVCGRNGPHGPRFPCSNGMCLFDKSECPLILPCPEGEFRCPNGMCGPDADFCAGFSSGCPLGMDYRCDDGMCAESEEYCVTTNGCPSFYPILCSNGMCVDDEEFCIDEFLANGCPRDMPYRCNEFKECVKSEEQCLRSTGCRFGYQKCANGECILMEESCENKTVCESPKVVCPVGGECRDYFDQCPTKSGCPMYTPFRCGNGDCKKSPKFCPSTIMCVAPTPYLCASGECVSSMDYCPKIRMCSPGHERCVDNMCRPTGQCRNICPQGNPIRCMGSGKCVKDHSQCVNPLEKDCVFSGMFWCGMKQECLSSPMGCMDGIACDTGQSRCWDGACVDALDACEDLQACSKSRPFRCMDGSCGIDPSNCSSVDACEIFEHRCGDGRCVPLIQKCPKIRGCPPGMLQCPNYKCKPTMEDCKEGRTQFMCWNGVFKDSDADCANPPKIPKMSFSCGSAQLEMSVADENSDEDVFQIVIPPYSVPSDSNSTLAGEEVSANIQIETTSDELIRMTVTLNSENGTIEGDKLVKKDLCSLAISITAFNVDGSTQSNVELAQPTLLRFKPTCDMEPGTKIYLGSINEETGEIEITSETTVVTVGNVTFLDGNTTHYSTFTLTKITELEIVVEETTADTDAPVAETEVAVDETEEVIAETEEVIAETEAVVADTEAVVAETEAEEEEEDDDDESEDLVIPGSAGKLSAVVLVLMACVFNLLF